MSYKDFDVKKVIKLLGYKVREQHFLTDIKPEQPSDKLLAAIDLLRGALVFGSEKSRSEALIAPILSDAALRTHTRLFSGENFDVDTDSGLNGIVDFLFVRDAPGRAIVDPVLCIVEAKKADVDSRAFGQCMATMVAAQRFNQHQSTIYGCVTTGNDWQFLRLTGDSFEIDPETYYENELPIVLGVLISFLGMRDSSSA